MGGFGADIDGERAGPGDDFLAPCAGLRLWELVERAAAERPDDVAIVWRGERIVYAALCARTRSAARWFAERAAEGERCLLWLPNCPEFVVAFHGALRAGLVVTAASPRLTRTEVEEQIADAEPAVVVADASRADELDRGSRHVLPVVPGAGLPAGGDVEPRRAGLPSLAVLQYTSGTTGGLKGAMMSHRNLVANALQNNLWFGWSSRDVVLGALPLCHTWGMGCVMNAAIAAGASVVLVEPGEPASVLEAVERHRVTVIYGSATLFSRLLDAAGAAAPRVFASCRYVKAGAMLVGDALPARWASAVPGVPMVLGYGLTEASPEVTDNPLDAPRPGTVGVPLPGTDVRIARPESPDEEVAAGEEGEIQVRGPQVTSGYWRRPEATARAFAAGGWLRTGDLGRFDEKGYLVVVDRLKDLVKFRGWSVVPAEVERALLAHPEVAEAAVVGARDPVDGEVPVAFVRRAAGGGVTAEGLAAHLAGRLADFKRPRRYVFVDEIPKNAVGKPLRRVLRDRL